MFWKILYNTKLYGVNQTSLDHWISLNKINFNWYDFSDIRIVNIPDDYGVWGFKIESYQRTTHGSWFSNWLIQDRTITIEGRIQAKNQADLERIITKIKANILVWQWILYLERKLWILKTKAVVSALEIPRETRTIDAIRITVSFKIQDPFFYSLKTTEQHFWDVNGFFNSTVFYKKWSHSAKNSVFITFKNAVSVDKILYSLGGKVLEIDEEVQSGDIFFIDAEKKDVAKNWVYGIDRKWEFGELNFGQNELQLDINWQFLMDVFIQYNNTYV